MKSRHIIFLCILTTVLYLLAPTISFSSSSLISLPGRRPMRKLSMSVPHDKHHKIDIEEEEIKGSIIEEGSMALEHGSSTRNNLDELVYHIDYHGVTTHPTPTPKHPKP